MLEKNEMMALAGLLSRFEEKIERIPECGCWIWLAASDSKGYGQIINKRRKQQAHRTAWELFKGEIPKKLCVLHRCDTPSCVNPHHLFLGTHMENMQDCKKKNRMKGCFYPGHNPKNIVKGQDHFRAVLTNEKVIRMREIYAHKKAGYKKIAKMFNIHPQTSRAVLKRKTWKHI